MRASVFVLVHIWESLLENKKGVFGSDKPHMKVITGSPARRK